VQITITHLIDDVQWYQTVRALRWPDGVEHILRVKSPPMALDIGCRTFTNRVKCWVWA
jgi:hypothetical protein